VADAICVPFAKKQRTRTVVEVNVSAIAIPKIADVTDPLIGEDGVAVATVGVNPAPWVIVTYPDPSVVTVLQNSQNALCPDGVCPAIAVSVAAASACSCDGPLGASVSDGYGRLKFGVVGTKHLPL
jgi:hypothetical protein